jgi:hypothetical protein
MYDANPTMPPLAVLAALRKSRWRQRLDLADNHLGDFIGDVDPSLLHVKYDLARIARREARAKVGDNDGGATRTPARGRQAGAGWQIGSGRRSGWASAGGLPGPRWRVTEGLGWFFRYR